MPTYEYKCFACEHQFEQFQSITAEPLKRCPACGKLKLKRLLGTGAGLIFKGSGFYITDYRSESYKSAAKAEGGTKSESKGESAKTGSDNSGSKGAAAKGDTKPSALKSDSGSTK